MITDDELAVLIMRACSSRNLFVKHHIIKKIVISHFFISFHNFDVLPYFTQINGRLSIRKKLLST